jgi:hypothetical protein
LTQKDQLYLSLQKACDNSDKDVFELMQITFVIDYGDQQVVQTVFRRFQLYLKTIEKHKNSGMAAINSAI